MIRPRFELGPLSESPFPPPLVSSLLEPAVAVGVTRTVFSTVTTPALPVERLVAIELKGVVLTESGVAVPEFESSVVEEAAEDRCADVCDAEFPPPDDPPLVARPVMVAMLGFVDA
jgi:hypothetical protein